MRVDSGKAETQFRQSVVDAAVALKWAVQYTHDSRRGPKSGNGFPDLVLVRGSRVLFRELKTDSEHSRLRPNQKQWGWRLTEAGADWAVWRPQDWGLIEKELR